MSRTSKTDRKNPLKNLHRQLHFEPLEDRSLPSCTAISGFVYYDLNNNGLYDTATETPIANSSIELRDAAGTVVGTATTDANGFYEFEKDMAHPTLDSTLTKTVTFDPTQTNFIRTATLDQWDPSLGQLESIEIQHSGSITSEIKVENFSQQSESDITGTVSGTLTLTGPGGLNSVVNLSGQAGSFHASTYDGDTDFAGASGESFGEKTATGADTVTLTGADMDAFKGTGQVTLTESAIATSNATGGGNLDVRVRSTGKSTVTVIYHYKAYDCLPPGDYKIVQTVQPAGYLDGKESKDGVVLPNTVGSDEISVHLAANTDAVNNNFGETKASSIAGHVYFDANDNGVFEPGEAPIADATVTLSGFDDNGPVSATMQTNAAGEYKFENLRPGTYALNETQPVGFADGKDTIGTPGGSTANDEFSNINLPAAFDGVNNDFGEIKVTPPPEVPTPLPKAVLPLGQLPIISKSQLLNDTTSAYLDPVIRGQMAFVVGMDVTLTGRQLDLNTTLNGVTALNAAGPQAYIDQVWAGDAHRALQADALYQSILGRMPTAAEQAQAIADLQTGTSEAALKEQLFTSAEYAQLHPTSDGLAAALFQDILNTTPSTPMVTSLVQSMDNQTLQDVVHNLLTSDTALVDQIDDAYRLTLRRPASGGEAEMWLPQLKSGTISLDELAKRLLSSQEFYQLTFNTIQ